MFMKVVANCRMMCIVDALWGLLKEEFHQNLRVVTYYDETEFETKMRSDLRNAYSEEEDKRIVEEVSLNGLHVPYLEDMFKTGELDSSIYVFDEAYVVQFPIDETQGIIVSIESNSDLSSVSFIKSSISEVESLQAETSSAKNHLYP